MGSGRMLLMALAAAVCIFAAGAGIAVITAGGSSQGTTASVPASGRASAPHHRPSSAKPQHHSAATAGSGGEATTTTANAPAAPAKHRRRPAASPGSLPPATKGAGALGPSGSDKTSCSNVVHIGDSTSEGLDAAADIPDRADRIGARYAAVGAQWHPEITGATSIVETLPGGTNAHQVAERLVANGYHGCWVIALGTNDAADVAVGSTVGLPTRIKEMMSTIGDQPVMWVNVRTLVSSGPYAETNMEGWDRALLAACPRYPNMRVYDWASIARDGWYIPDGIHYSAEGDAIRARLIADALAKSFPASGLASGCVVR
jgi:lysophospholipase L1-like esterase